MGEAVGPPNQQYGSLYFCVALTVYDIKEYYGGGGGTTKITIRAFYFLISNGSYIDKNNHVKRSCIQGKERNTKKDSQVKAADGKISPVR